MRTRLLTDLIDLAVCSYPPPKAEDEIAMQAYVSMLAGKTCTIVYDILATETNASKQLLMASMDGMVTDSEIEAAYAKVCTGSYGSVSKIGDGKILEWLKTLPWSQIIAIIVALVPK